MGEPAPLPQGTAYNPKTRDKFLTELRRVRETVENVDDRADPMAYDLGDIAMFMMNTAPFFQPWFDRYNKTSPRLPSLEHLKADGRDISIPSLMAYQLALKELDLLVSRDEQVTYTDRSTIADILNQCIGIIKFGVINAKDVSRQNESAALTTNITEEERRDEKAPSGQFAPRRPEGCEEIYKDGRPVVYTHDELFELIAKDMEKIKNDKHYFATMQPMKIVPPDGWRNCWLARMFHNKPKVAKFWSVVLIAAGVIIISSVALAGEVMFMPLVLAGTGVALVGGGLLSFCSRSCSHFGVRPERTS